MGLGVRLIWGQYVAATYPHLIQFCWGELNQQGYTLTCLSYILNSAPRMSELKLTLSKTCKCFRLTKIIFHSVFPEKIFVFLWLFFNIIAFLSACIFVSLGLYHNNSGAVMSFAGIQLPSQTKRMSERRKINECSEVKWYKFL